MEKKKKGVSEKIKTDQAKYLKEWIPGEKKKIYIYLCGHYIHTYIHTQSYLQENIS